MGAGVPGPEQNGSEHNKAERFGQTTPWDKGYNKRADEIKMFFNADGPEMIGCNGLCAVPHQVKIAGKGELVQVAGALLVKEKGEQGSQQHHKEIKGPYP